MATPERLAPSDSPVAVAALCRVERALQPLLQPSLLEERAAATSGSRQPGKCWSSTPGVTPSATPRGPLMSGALSARVLAASSGSPFVGGLSLPSRLPQPESPCASPDADYSSSLSPVLQTREHDAPAADGVEGPCAPRGQRPFPVPGLNLASVHRAREGGGPPGPVGNNGGGGGGVVPPAPSTSGNTSLASATVNNPDGTRSAPRWSPFREPPRNFLALQQEDVYDPSSASGGAGPVLYGPSGPPGGSSGGSSSVSPLQLRQPDASGFGDASPGQRQPSAGSSTALNIPAPQVAGSLARLPGIRLNGIPNREVRVEAPLFSNGGGDSSGSRSEASASHSHSPARSSSRNDVPNGPCTVDDENFRITSEECCVDGADCCGEAPSSPRGRRMASVPLAASVHSATDDWESQEAPPADQVQWRITNVVRLLNKVQECIEQQHVVSQAKTQEFEKTLLAESDAEAGSNPPSARQNRDEDSSDSSTAIGDGDGDGDVDGDFVEDRGRHS